MSTEAYVFDAIRTPRGRGRETGALHQVPTIQLLTTLFDTLQQRHDLDTTAVDDVMLGCVTPVGEQGANIARTALLYAGWDVGIPGMQINRFCASGLETVNTAAMKIRSGWEALIVAGGVESMSRVPMGSDGGALMDDAAVSDAIGFVPQGISADLIATREGFSRAELDRYALRSQRRAAHAEQNGYFERARVPVRDVDGAVLLDHEEHIRPDTTLEALGGLKPAFAKMGAARFDAVARRKYPTVDALQHVHTAGNSSGIVDGAALVLVGSREQGAALGLTPRARIVSAALVGSEPTIMLTGPAPATQRALQQAGMTLADIDLIEVNEAFAAVVLKFQRDMALDDLDRVNVNGGAIAMGHPLGATGAMILGAAVDEMERADKQTALVTLCVASGMGAATILERV